MNNEEQVYLEQLQAEVEQERAKSAKLQRDYGQISMFSGEQNSNLIQWQLDLREELERIEHILHGHIIKRDSENNEYWAEPEDPDLKPFNDQGVHLLMNIISFYLNRNTILSNYDEETINAKMKDLGDEVADLIFMKYETMGMDTKEKQKLFAIMVRQIVDTIHSAYLRALRGGERESLRTARHVTESANVGPWQPSQNQSQNKVRLLHPSTWRNI